MENTEEIFGDYLKELHKKTLENKYVLYKRNYDEYTKFNFMKALGKPGLELIDHNLISRLDKVVGYMVKGVGKTVFSGQNLSQVSIPIFINDERSMLEALIVPARYAYLYLNKAVEAMKLERMKLITTYFINILHLGMAGYKPFNPILGETFQSIIYPPKFPEELFKYKGHHKNPVESEYDLDNPTHIYVEQTSHHPPIFNFYGKNKDYILYGYREKD